MPFFTAIIALLTVSSVVTAAFDTVAYRATIQPLFTTSTTPAEGFVTIFTESSKSVIGYSGIVTKLESNLVASRCTALNGCGVHIHAGRSCFNTTTQGSHYYINTTVPIDPWIDERYSSDSSGKANFHSIIQIGSIDIDGRVFIVYSKNGTRIGCGIIERVPVSEKQLLQESTRAAAAIAAPTKTIPIVPRRPTFIIRPPPKPGPPSPTPMCGLFGLSIFCPITFCGIFGRFFGLCN